MMNSESQKALCGIFRGQELPQRLPPPLKRLEMRKQDLLLFGGFPIRSIYFLISGHCGVSVVNEDGVVTIADVYHPMQVFGVTEILAGVPDFLANVYISSDRATVVECPADFFLSEVRDCHELSLLLNGYLGQLLARNMRNRDRSAREEPKRALLEYLYVSAIDKELPYVCPAGREELASSLQLNPRTLYRYLKDLTGRGYLSNVKGKTVITRENYRRMEALLTEGK